MTVAFSALSVCLVFLIPLSLSIFSRPPAAFTLCLSQINTHSFTYTHQPPFAYPSKLVTVTLTEIKQQEKCCSFYYHQIAVFSYHTMILTSNSVIKMNAEMSN